MSAHYIWTTSRPVTRPMAEAIDRAIKAINPKATFVRSYRPGDALRGWIERPHDDWADKGLIGDLDARCIATAADIIGPVSYEVREDGRTAWWEGASLRTGRKELRIARERGLSRARLHAVLADDRRRTIA